MKPLTCTCGACKTCRNREQNRRYRKRVGREILRERARESYAKHRPIKVRDPIQRYAQRAVQLAIARGDLNREDCEVCGERAQAHHEDYSRPLDVRWLCQIHHSARHMEMAR